MCHLLVWDAPNSAMTRANNIIEGRPTSRERPDMQVLGFADYAGEPAVEASAAT